MIAKRKDFAITLTACTLGLNAAGNPVTQARTYFEPDGNVDIPNSALNLDAASTATNVQVQILNSDFSTILLGLGNGLQGVTPVNFAGASPAASATLPYVAQYFHAGGAAPTVGTVVAHTLYTIDYL